MPELSLMVVRSRRLLRVEFQPDGFESAVCFSLICISPSTIRIVKQLCIVEKGLKAMEREVESDRLCGTEDEPLQRELLSFISSVKKN